MFTKSQFMSSYKRMTEREKENAKQAWNEVLKNAMFIDTYELAEKVLLWMREAER